MQYNLSPKLCPKTYFTEIPMFRFFIYSSNINSCMNSKDTLQALDL